MAEDQRTLRAHQPFWRRGRFLRQAMRSKLHTSMGEKLRARPVLVGVSGALIVDGCAPVHHPADRSSVARSAEAPMDSRTRIILPSEVLNQTGESVLPKEQHLDNITERRKQTEQHEREVCAEILASDPTDVECRNITQPTSGSPALPRTK